MFPTLHLPAKAIANIYKARWQVELFFSCDSSHDFRAGATAKHDGNEPAIIAATVIIMGGTLNKTASITAEHTLS